MSFVWLRSERRLLILGYNVKIKVKALNSDIEIKPVIKILRRKAKQAAIRLEVYTLSYLILLSLPVSSCIRRSSSGRALGPFCVIDTNDQATKISACSNHNVARIFMNLQTAAQQANQFSVNWPVGHVPPHYL